MTFHGQAHGRVNLIGEHTDYNGGYVLPLPIPHSTRIFLTPLAGLEVNASTTVPGSKKQSYFIGQETKQNTWIDYLQGSTKILREQGYLLNGFDVTIESNIPIGAGLSSSAALLVAFFRTLKMCFDLQIDDLQIALLSQRVENEFVGANVGIMDQLAASFAVDGKALYINTSELTVIPVSLPSTVEIFVINSGIKHSHATGGYNTRRQECLEAAKALGVKQLCDIDMAHIDKIEVLPDKLRKRAKHVISENKRVHSFYEALVAHKTDLLGQLMNESHDSMRNDFEVSTTEIDLLTAIAQRSAIGARLTGGGFGGSIIGLVPKGEAFNIASSVAEQYNRQAKIPATLVIPGKLAPFCN